MRLTMTLRMLGMVALLVAAVPATVSAQCVFLGAPGFTGCAPGGGSAPAIFCNATPNLGADLGIGVTTSPWSINPAFLVFGTCATPPSSGPSPSPLCPPSLSGCFIHVDFGGPIISSPPQVLSWNTVATLVTVAIPNDPGLVGQVVCAQLLGIWAPMVSPCVQVSNGLSITILP